MQQWLHIHEQPNPYVVYLRENLCLCLEGDKMPPRAARHCKRAGRHAAKPWAMLRGTSCPARREMRHAEKGSSRKVPVSRWKEPTC